MEVAEQFKGKKIKFISISIDKDKKAWLNYVKENELKGLQFHMAENQNFMKAFGIRGIPHFILLDKKGNVVENGAFRPTQTDSLVNLLKNLKDI